MKKILIIVAFFILFILLFDFLLSNFFLKSHTEKVVINGVEMIAEIADSENKIKKGLSGRNQLGEAEGMLFVFEKPSIHSFWMKDMKFSIDIIWIDEALKIIDIAKNVSPDTYPRTFQSSKPVKYVLEVKAGWTEKYNVNKGDKVYFEN